MRAPTGQRRASRGSRWGPRAARGPAAPACDAAVPCCAAGRTTPAQRHRLVQGLVCELGPPQQGRRSRWPSGQRRPKLSWLRGGRLLAPLAAGGMRRAPRPARSAPACGRAVGSSCALPNHNACWHVPPFGRPGSPGLGLAWWPQEVGDASTPAKVATDPSQVEECAPPPCSCSTAASTAKSSASWRDGGSGSAVSAGCGACRYLASMHCQSARVPKQHRMHDTQDHKRSCVSS